MINSNAFFYPFFIVTALRKCSEFNLIESVCFKLKFQICHGLNTKEELTPDSSIVALMNLSLGRCQARRYGITKRMQKKRSASRYESI